LVVEEIPEEHTVRAHIKGLRQKLKAAGAPADLIETIYGLGYRLKPEQQEAEQEAGKHLPLASRLAPNLKQQTMAEVASVWERHKEKFSNRISVS